MYEQIENPAKGGGRKDNMRGLSFSHSDPSGSFIFSPGETLGAKSALLSASHLAMDSINLRASDSDPSYQ